MKIVQILIIFKDMKYSLVIFDLDGTILNTLDDLADSLNVSLKNNALSTYTVEEVRFMVGNGIRKLIERAVPGAEENPKFQKVYDDFVEYYRNHCLEKTAPYQGMTECLKELKARGCKIAVNTNKDEVAAIELCKRFFPGLIDCISGGKDSIPVKPSPLGVYSICKKLGLCAGNTCGAEEKPDEKILSGLLFVGDSDVDIATGLNAGIDAVGAEWGFRGKAFLIEHGAKMTAAAPLDLLNLIV